MIRHRSISRIISDVTFAYVTSSASASRATCKIASGVESAARRNWAPSFERTLRAGSRVGKTESETATSRFGMLSLPLLRRVRAGYTSRANELRLERFRRAAFSAEKLDVE